LTLIYKQTEQQMGVYRIKNEKNGKLLVGSSPNLDGIWNRHQFELSLGNHRNRQLQQEWNEYGADAFSFEVLERLKPRNGEPPTKVSYKKELGELEAKWLERLQPYGEKGYN
jgi:group I intron endonuclease